MKKTILLYICVLIFLPCVRSYAQNSLVKGTVKDMEGTPLAGATVLVDGTKPAVYAITDLDGQYSIKVPQGKTRLVFSLLGMTSESLILSQGQTVANMVLCEEAQMLEQVVVTGYAQTTVKKMTGSVGVVTVDKIKDNPLTSIDAILQGEISGVKVNAVSGQPGRSQQIKIRGTSTLSTNGASPLWVVDGVPLQNESPNMTDSELKAAGFESLFVDGIGSINPNDIESVTVLKDAAASAIYGSRASNGVIVVTTRHGNEGRMQVNYSANMSVTMAPIRSSQLMNSSQKIAWEQELWDEFAAERFANGASHYPVVGIVGIVRSGRGEFASMAGDTKAQDNYLQSLTKETTDWFKVVTQNAISTNHHISISGGNRNSNYYLALGYTFNQGSLRKDAYNRYSLRGNYTAYTAKQRLKIDTGIEMSHQSSTSPELSSTDPFTYAYYANPYEKPYNKDGSYRTDYTYNSLQIVNGDDYSQIDTRGFNIMREIDHTSSATRDYSATARLQGDLKIMDWLHLVGLASYTFSNTSTVKILLSDTNSAYEDKFMSYTNPNYLGSKTTNTALRTSFIARAHLAFNKTFVQAHTVSVIAGAEVRGSDSSTRFSKGYGYDPNTDTSTIPVPGNGQMTGDYINALTALNGDYYTSSRYASFYCSADYFYKERYVFNASVRNDGSSYFGSKRQFFPTWSLGAAWNISKENWMQATSSWLDRLTLRAATGFTGNINNGVSPQLILHYTDQTYREIDGERYNVGKFLSAPNPNLRWEKTQDYKASLDMAFFSERLALTAEVYRRNSQDVVYSTMIPTYTGFSYQKYNSVDMMNQGIELSLNADVVRHKGFALNVAVNFAYNQNRITKLKSVDELSINTRYVEGYPVNSIFAGKVMGIDPYSGLIRFQQRSDSVISTKEDYNDPNNYRFYLGTSECPYSGGFSVRASYKFISLSISGIYMLGGKSYESTSAPVSYSNLRNKGNNANVPLTWYNDLYKNHLNVTADRVDRWKNVNDTGTKYPRIYDPWAGDGLNYAAENPTSMNIVGGAYLKDNSFLRFKTMMLVFTMPAKITRKMKLTTFRINLCANNLFTITNYEGLDPEAPGSIYPQSKSVTLGFNIGF